MLSFYHVTLSRRITKVARNFSTKCITAGIFALLECYAVSICK